MTEQKAKTKRFKPLIPVLPEVIEDNTVIEQPVIDTTPQPVSKPAMKIISIACDRNGTIRGLGEDGQTVFYLEEPSNIWRQQ